MRKEDFIILFFILLTAIVFRLYKINTPLADLHSWRQADTAAVARNFVKNGFDLLHPRFDDLSPNQSAAGLENPEGYRMVEFPIYNAIFAFLYKNFPQLSLEIWGRITSIFFSLIIIALIYYFVLKETNIRMGAVASSLVYAVFPFFVFFSRAILPETTALSFVFISIFFLYQTLNKSINRLTDFIFYFFSIIFFSLSILTKPTVIFYALVLVYIFYLKYKIKFLKNIGFYLYFLFSLLPFFLWRWHATKFPEGIPPSDWLITSVNTYQGLKNIFLKPAFFRWVFFERINNLIFGGYLTFFFLLGVFGKLKKKLLYSFLAAAFLYLFTFQGGNVQHEYYQTVILPSSAIFIGLGLNCLLNYKKVFISAFLAYPLIFLIFILSFFFSFYKVKDFYNYPPELPQIAKIINSLTLPDDKIITDRMGDTTLLYLAERRGAPSVYKDPDELKKIGYKYLVTQNPEKIKEIKTKKNYQVVFENNQFVIFKL